MLSPAAVLLGVFVLIIILAQFGGRVAARSSLTWWLGLGLFMLSAVAPQMFRPVADFFGIQLVSNFVLASMIIFLSSQLIEQMAMSTSHMRGHRRLVSRMAARDYIEKQLPLLTAADPNRPRVLVTLPCYNETQSLPSLIPALTELANNKDYEFLYCIVDDGSRDGSDDLLRSLAPTSHTTHLSNIGVAGVLLTGFEIGQSINADYVVQCDADGQHPVQMIPAMIAAARAEGADLLVGSRFITDERTGSQSTLDATTPLRRAGGMLILMVLRLFGKSAAISDPTSGFRVYSRRIFVGALNGMPDEYPEPEMLALAAVFGGRIREIGVTMVPRSTGTSSITGLRTARYMLKVVTALLGLRLRTLIRRPVRVA